MTVGARSPRRGSHRLDPAWPMVAFAIAVAVSPEFNFLGVEKVRISDLLLPILLLVFLGAKTTEVKRGRRTRRTRPPEIPLLGLMLGIMAWDLTVWAMFSEQGPLREGAMYLVKRAEFFLIYFLGVSVVTSEWAWTRIIRLFVLASPILSLSVLWELWTRPELQRASGMIKGQETSTGLFIVVVLGLVMGVWPTVKESGERMALVLAGTTGAAALLATGSRAGLLCAALVVGSQVLRDRRARSGLIVILAFVAIPTWFFMPARLQDRIVGAPGEISSTWRGLVINPEEMPSAGSSSVAARAIIAREVLTQVIPRGPIFGLGTARMTLGLVDNFYITEWIYHGIVGLALFMALVWSMLGLLRKVHEEADSPMLGSIASAMRSVLWALIVSGLAAESFYLIRPMEAFMLLVGLAVGRYRLGLMEAAAAEPGAPPTAAPERRRR